MSNDTQSTIAGLWSATPTPFTAIGEVDIDALGRLIELHIQYGVEGLFLGGTCGEGAWMSDKNKVLLLSTASKLAKGQLKIAFQASDNSPQRVAQNSKLAADNGADIAVISHAPQSLNATPEGIRKFFLKAFDSSHLPVGFYDLGSIRPNGAHIDHLSELALHPKVVLTKDSSSNPKRRDALLAAKAQKPDLKLYCGDEFNGCDYIAHGYDGLMLGGLAFHGNISNRMLLAAKDGRHEEALELQKAYCRILYVIYGPKVKNWLNGLKYSLLRLGVFNTSITLSGFAEIPDNSAEIDALLSTIQSPLQLGELELASAS